MVPMQGMPVRGAGLFLARTGILLWLSLGVDLGPDSGNAPGCWFESSVKQPPSWPCQKSQGWRSWPVMTCWLQITTCEHALPRGGWSTSWWAPRLPSSIPFQAAAWGRSTPKALLSLAPSHRLLQWWGADGGRCNWGHGWTSVLPRCQPWPSATSVWPSASWVMWWWNSRHLCNHWPRGWWRSPLWHWACPCRTELPLDSVVQSRGRSSSSGTSMISGCFDAMSLFWNLPEEGATLGVATSKTRQIMVFLVGTSAYIGSMTLICSPTPGQFFYTNQSPSSIHYLWSISRYGGQSQHCWSKENHLQAPTAGTLHMQLQGKHSWIFWNDIRTHSQSYIKMYKWPVYCVPLILLNF